MKKPVYLIMVTAENNNKYYNMFPINDSIFEVKYGRVGGAETSKEYDMWEWDKKLNEKLHKGYKDITDLKTSIVEEIKKDGSNKSYKEIENESVRKIINKLLSLARDTVKRNYTIKEQSVTNEMVDEAQNIIDELSTNTDTYSVEQFNHKLIELFGVIPRKMEKVQLYLAVKSSDFASILQREQDLLDVMRGQITSSNSKSEDVVENKSEKTLLDEIGITMSEATSDDINIIKKLMGESAHHFRNAWVVTNKETQDKFDKYVRDNNITKTKLLFHGSRNENWFSILKTGLKIRPTNATINGKMFGYGSYFAPKCQKSIGYTSLKGSYWASGSSDKAYMAIFETAYGKAYDVYAFDSKFYNFTYDSLKYGCNCLHAHAGSMLKNDEIVYYKEEQMTIKYLIEIG